MSDFALPPDDVDPGEPLAQLVALREQPSAAFLPRVRGGILRRVAGTQFLDFGVNALLDFLKAIGELIFGLLGGTEPGGGESDER